MVRRGVKYKRGNALLGELLFRFVESILEDKPAAPVQAEPSRYHLFQWQHRPVPRPIRGPALRSARAPSYASRRRGPGLNRVRRGCGCRQRVASSNSSPPLSP